MSRRNRGLSLETHEWLDVELLKLRDRLRALCDVVGGAHGAPGTDAFLRAARAVDRLRSWLDNRCVERTGQPCMRGAEQHRRLDVQAGATPHEARP